MRKHQPPQKPFALVCGVLEDSGRVLVSSISPALVWDLRDDVFNPRRGALYGLVLKEALKELWSENRWAQDSQGKQIATAFVLQDPDGRELDVHAMSLDGGGNGIPAFNNSASCPYASAACPVIALTVSLPIARPDTRYH